MDRRTNGRKDGGRDNKWSGSNARMCGCIGPTCESGGRWNRSVGQTDGQQTDDRVGNRPQTDGGSDGHAGARSVGRADGRSGRTGQRKSGSIVNRNKESGRACRSRQTERTDQLDLSDQRTDSATVGRSCRRVSRLDWQDGLDEGRRTEYTQQIDGRSVGRKDVLTGMVTHGPRRDRRIVSARACVEV